MQNSKYAAYKGADPYFNLVRRALGDVVDGEHFFDVVADNVVYEVLYEIAGWPQTIQGRADLMARFRGLLRQRRTSVCGQADHPQGRRRPYRRHRIRSPRDHP